MAAGWQSNIPKRLTADRQALARAVKDAADEIVERAKIAAPVDTGFLQDSIEATHPEELTSIVTVGAEYGVYVELGTVFRAARPYLGPAVDVAITRLGGTVRRMFNK